MGCVEVVVQIQFHPSVLGFSSLLCMWTYAAFGQPGSIPEYREQNLHRYWSAALELRYSLDTSPDHLVSQHDPLGSKRMSPSALPKFHMERQKQRRQSIQTGQASWKRTEHWNECGSGVWANAEGIDKEPDQQSYRPRYGISWVIAFCPTCLDLYHILLLMSKHCTSNSTALRRWPGFDTMAPARTNSTYWKHQDCPASSIVSNWIPCFLG